MNFKEKYAHLSPVYWKSHLSVLSRLGYGWTSSSDLQNPRPVFLMNEQMIKDILSFWKDPVIQESWQHTGLDRYSRGQLTSPILGYFMDHFHLFFFFFLFSFF